MNVTVCGGISILFRYEYTITQCNQDYEQTITQCGGDHLHKHSFMYRYNKYQQKCICLLSFLFSIKNSSSFDFFSQF